MVSNIVRRLAGPSAAETAALQEAQIAKHNATLLAEKHAEVAERLAELEAVLLTPEWSRLTADGEREFGLEGLRAAMKISRLMFLSNPLINRAITLKSQYVFGQGFTLTTKGDVGKAALDRLMNSARNRRAFTSHQMLTLREQELEVTGNLFIALVKVGTDTEIRCIPAAEIEEIISDPEDAANILFYRRRFAVRNGKQLRQVEKLYADLHYSGSIPPAVENVEVVPNTRVYHVRIGALADMRFGLPEMHQSIPWARSYKDFLTDFIAIVKSFRKFAFTAQVEGGPSQVAEVHSKLNTQYGTGGNYTDTNAAPVAGSTAVMSGATLTPVKTAGATVPLEEGRRLLLMHCAGSGFPETFYGDASVGSLATAKSLDRPTELMISDRQKLWANVLETIANYAIASTAGGEVEDVSGSFATCSFPPVVEHDMKELVEGLAMATTLDGKPVAETAHFETMARLMLEAVGVKDVEPILKEIMARREEMEAEKQEMRAAMRVNLTKPEPEPAGEDNNVDPREAKFSRLERAIRYFSEALSR